MNVSNEHDRIDKLLNLYVSNEIDKKQFSELKEWAVASADNNKYVRDRLEIWVSSNMLAKEDNDVMEMKYEKIVRKIEKDETFALKRTKLSTTKIFRIAAATVVIILLPLFGFLAGQSSIKTAFNDIKTETTLGARTKLLLPDGSIVWMNAGSSLQYSQDFGIYNRNIALKGEAFFDVKQNKKLPFIISTKEIGVKVLGTKFNFCNYPEDGFAQIDLVKGKVFIEEKDNGQKMYLEPNQRMRLDKRTKHINRKNIDASLSAEWTQGRLVIDELNLKDIAGIIARSYNVNIVVTKSIQNETFNGNFDIRHNSVDDILRAIALTKQMKYRYEGGTYYLY